MDNLHVKDVRQEHVVNLLFYNLKQLKDNIATIGKVNLEANC